METTNHNIKPQKEKEFSFKQVSQNELQVMLNNKYTIDKNSKYFEVIPFVIDLINEKNNLEKKKYHDVF